MASDIKKANKSDISTASKKPPPPTEVAKAEPAKTEPAKTELAKAEPAKAEPAKAESGDTAGAAPANYSRGEGQKMVTQAYRDNWNAIYGDKKKKKR